MGYGELIRVLGEEAAREARQPAPRGRRPRSASGSWPRPGPPPWPRARRCWRGSGSRPRPGGGRRWPGWRWSGSGRCWSSGAASSTRCAPRLRAPLAAAVDDDVLARLVGEVLAAAPSGRGHAGGRPGRRRARCGPRWWPPTRRRWRGPSWSRRRARRGGVELRAGRLVLDDTLPLAPGAGLAPPRAGAGPPALRGGVVARLDRQRPGGRAADPAPRPGRAARAGGPVHARGAPRPAPDRRLGRGGAGRGRGPGLEALEAGLREAQRREAAGSSSRWKARWPAACWRPSSGWPRPTR